MSTRIAIAINDAVHILHVISPLIMRYPQSNRIPVIIITRMGEKKHSNNVDKNDSSIASDWCLMPDNKMTIVSMQNASICTCQQVCSVGMAEIPTQYVRPTNGEGNLVFPVL